MWRSKARDVLLRYSRLVAPVRCQVAFETLPVIRTPPLHSSTFISHNKSCYRSIRLFSHDSAPIAHEFGDQVHSESPSSPALESADASTSTSGGFDENPRFLSHEPETSSVLSDEISSLESQESGAPSLNLEVGIDEEGPEGESPDPLFQEAGNCEDQMSEFVPEEPFEEAPDETPDVDMEQVENVLSVLQSSLDGSLESSLDKMDLTLTEEFVVRVLQTPLVLGGNLIGFFKWASRKPGFSVTSRVIDSLVRAVAAGLRKKDAYALWDLVKEIGERENAVLTTDALNELISLFWKLGKGKAGLEVFNKFEEFGCIPNADSYYFTIEALCCRSFFDWAWSVCEKMLNSGNLPESEKIGNVISCFCKGEKAKDAHLVFLMAKEKNKYPPHSSITFLITSLCREDETVRLALELLEEFSGKAQKYAIKPFSSVVRGLCRIKDVDGAKNLLFKMIDAGPPPGNAVFNSVINGLSKAGEMDDALALVKMMESRGLRPDIYTYSVIMSGYVKKHQMDDACRILSEAKKKHSKLSPVTYHILIRGYCRLEEFDKALKLLSEMKKYGVQPNPDEYNKLIQSLCLKALDWETAEKLLQEMKENGLHLNGITRGLIRAVKELGEEELQSGGITSET
ncbi:PREDICTED: pentatricopeptide repeat-containing protein At3g02650, mitochondrial [Nelumbo nucifera]|uniref:Pentatricopeptide repeat-containing protein At3g02650, mitochondrial n=1 Tax=Nelumbo nucifera TaxID=4432 RepID=A0A1U7YWY3_NELNU|nr:PREDICTED: pentatricopeptide repeat-containing protein At3g02650, mitochondrial [Nelumbo nucifera]